MELSNLSAASFFFVCLPFSATEPAALPPIILLLLFNQRKIFLFGFVYFLRRFYPTTISRNIFDSFLKYHLIAIIIFFIPIIEQLDTDGQKFLL